MEFVRIRFLKNKIINGKLMVNYMVILKTRKLE